MGAPYVLRSFDTNPSTRDGSQIEISERPQRLAVALALVHTYQKPSCVIRFLRYELYLRVISQKSYHMCRVSETGYFTRRIQTIDN